MSLTIQQSLTVRKAMAEGDWDTVHQMLYDENDEYGDDPNDPRRIEKEPDDDEFVRLFFEE